MGAALVGCHTPPASVAEPLELPELEPLEEPELEPLEPLDPELLEPPELLELEPEPPELEVPASFCAPPPCDEPPEEHAIHADDATVPSARSRASRPMVGREPMVR